jgi:hypothetical protein
MTVRWTYNHTYCHPSVHTTLEAFGEYCDWVEDRRHVCKSMTGTELHTELSRVALFVGLLVRDIHRSHFNRDDPDGPPKYDLPEFLEWTILTLNDVQDWLLPLCLPLRELAMAEGQHHQQSSNDVAVPSGGVGGVSGQSRPLPQQQGDVTKKVLDTSSRSGKLTVQKRRRAEDSEDDLQATQATIHKSPRTGPNHTTARSNAHTSQCPQQECHAPV